MHQIKIFRGSENQLPQLEAQVNDWLAASKVKVLNIFGNLAPQSVAPDAKDILTEGAFAASDAMLIVHYEKFDSKVSAESE